jgi:hypothetical protein
VQLSHAGQTKKNELETDSKTPAPSPPRREDEIKSCKLCRIA